MKGIVFTEFEQMIEEAFGEEMMDDLIDSTEPASGGSYTSVGTYSHEELVAMVIELSRRTGTPVPDLIRAFGHHLAKAFVKKFKIFFDDVDNTLEFLKRIDNHIHVEVAKLYPDAELPEFDFDDSDPETFFLNYSSKRGFADLAQGLIEATSQYYKESFLIERKDSVDGEVYVTQFKLMRQ